MFERINWLHTVTFTCIRLPRYLSFVWPPRLRLSPPYFHPTLCTKWMKLKPTARKEVKAFRGFYQISVLSLGICIWLATQFEFVCCTHTHTHTSTHVSLPLNVTIKKNNSNKKHKAKLNALSDCFSLLFICISLRTVNESCICGCPPVDTL